MAAAPRTARVLDATVQPFSHRAAAPIPPVYDISRSPQFLAASPANPRRANRWYPGWTSSEQGLAVGPLSATCRVFRRDHWQHSGRLLIEERAKTQRNRSARATPSPAVVAAGPKGSRASKRPRVRTDLPVPPEAAALHDGGMSGLDVRAGLLQGCRGGPLHTWVRGRLQNSVNTAVTA
jgi:hypothetical protein